MAVPSPVAGAASLRAGAVSGVPTTDPGSIVTFTLSVNNTGPALAARVWANVSYPPFTTFAGEARLPMWMSSQWFSSRGRGWNFTNLPPANHTWDLSLQILVGPQDRQVLSLPFFVNYTDDLGAKQPQTVAIATVTVSIPVIAVTMTPSTNPVDPGQPVSYLVAVENRGSATASDVWMNDTLPPQVTFRQVSPNPFRNQHCPSEPDCGLTNLAPSVNQTYSIDVTVMATVPRGTTFLNWLFVNFTDSDGTVLPPVSGQASIDVRVIRDLTLTKVATEPYTFRGQLATFIIWYNNTVAGSLGTTWINDTLPAGLTHDLTNPPATVAGSAVRWVFSSVASGPHSVTLVARVSSSATGGTILVNSVLADYRDGTGQLGERVQSSAGIVVSANLPSFDDFAKVASASSVVPGGSVQYTIYYNNTGTNTSALVVIEDTIPMGTVLANPSDPAANVTGRHYTWRFANVLAGAQRTLTYKLVLQESAQGPNLVNSAFLNFTDPLGGPLPPPGFRSAVVQLTANGDGGPGGVGGGGIVLPLIGGAVVVAAVAGLLGYRVIAARKKTVIDEVFLLHKDGLLIKHYTRRMRPDVDSDILSGMLIAVQNFVNESFIGAEGLQREGTLDELRFGEFKIVIERGESVIVAAVLTGDPTNKVKDEVKAAIRDLEGVLGKELATWRGDMRSVEGADRFIQDLITGKYRRAWGKG